MPNLQILQTENSQTSNISIMNEAKIIGECYKIRTLFDSEQQKTDKDYIAIIEDIWLRAFRDTEPELLDVAIRVA